MIWYLILSFLLIIPSIAEAFSTSSPVTCTTTVTPANLQTAINSAVTDGTAVICVTAGTVALPTINGNKDIVIAGPTNYVGGTGTVTLTGGGTWSNTSAPWKGSRMTGFTHTIGGGQSLFLSGLIGYRIDHMIVNKSAWDNNGCYNPIGSSVGGVSASPSEGLFDHNTFTNCRNINDGGYTGGGGTNGFPRWSEPLALGSTHCNYYEDNTAILNDTAIHNITDANLGGSVCFRMNSVTNQYVEFHSIQGQLRAARKGEYYGNSFTGNPPTNSRMCFFRGGVGLMFLNAYLGDWGGDSSCDLDNVRSIEDRTSDQFGPWGWCEGPGSSGQTLVVDGNFDSSGYLCRDQIGASTDAFNWPYPGSTGPVPSQALQPWLFWKNTAPGFSDMTWRYNNSLNVTFPKLGQQIQVNRNVFSSSASPSQNPVAVNCTAGGACTNGIGVGTSFPATCTPITDTLASGGVVGPYFWRTDLGSWNTSSSNPQGVQLNGADGQMFKCTATNTWTLFYEPFTYPHPLQVANPDITPPSDVTNLTAIAINTSQINLDWDDATDNIAVDHYNVERCSGAACVNFVQIATPLVSSLNDNGLTPATIYRYRVKAVDSSSNPSTNYSSIAQATTNSTTTSLRIMNGGAKLSGGASMK